MVNQSVNTHLSRENIIKQGGFFTGRNIVQLVVDTALPYISPHTVIADFGSGYGAFIEAFQFYGKRCFGTEIDGVSVSHLRNKYPHISFYHENSLLHVERQKYSLDETDELFAVGNPPYNDVTSQYKKGEKGLLNCDADIKSRDMGIAFLKAYDKLGASFVCVLHPLSYLIKKQNFLSLGSFREHYRIINATIFSSNEFESIRKTNAEFPVVAALYQRDRQGMFFEDIQCFPFSVFESQQTFQLNRIQTIDGIVAKYPSKSNFDNSLPRPRLQFYTLRDMNALFRNASFVEGPISNGVDVSIDTLYQYAWLLYLKDHFPSSKQRYLFGNLSPLWTYTLFDPAYQNQAVSYAYHHCEFVRKYFPEESLSRKYGPISSDYSGLSDELSRLFNLFS